YDLGFANAALLCPGGTSREQPGVSNLFSVVELVALRRVAPRPAAQRLPANRAVRASRSAAARACAAEASRLTSHMSATPVDELISADAASAPRRRCGGVAARQ